MKTVTRFMLKVFTLILALVIPVFTLTVASCPNADDSFVYLQYGEGNPASDSAFSTGNIKSPNLTITINSDVKYQYVRGFGGMDSAWSSPKMEIEEYQILFDPDKLGYNIFRIMIPPGNTNVSESMKSVHRNYIDAVKLVNSYGGYVLASPWTPPAAWKSNNSTVGGGSLLPAHYSNYANYLKAFTQYMNSNGAPIYAVSIQNEPDWVVSYDGCEWTPEQMRDFHKQVGRFTSGVPGYGGGKSNPHVLIMSGESLGRPTINDAALNDPQSKDVIDLIGRHLYQNAQYRSGNAIDNAKKEVWMTEYNRNSGKADLYPNDSTWDYVWVFLNMIDVSMRLNDESAFIWWYSKRFYSLIGDGEYGATEGRIMPRGYALSHYAKFAKEKRRIGLTVSGKTASGEDIALGFNFNNSGFNANTVAAKATAFMSEDGNEISIVLFTPTSTSGAYGLDLGVVQINLPAGFTAAKATAMRSTAKTKAGEQTVILSADKKSAMVRMPPGNILSVSFTK